VLTYDRRGNSRSTVDDPARPLRMAEQSADALAVLAHHDLGSALVFGGSGGALVGLDLAARHPDAVDGLVAHEPPVIDWLPDAAVHRALFDEIDGITRREGPWPAYLRFVTTIDRAGSPAFLKTRTGRLLGRGAGRFAAHGPRPLREVARVLHNSPYLMTCEVIPFLAFEPDLAALSASGIPSRNPVRSPSRCGGPSRDCGGIRTCNGV
jgi:pimeloyl-ACP methyl ester carboxylesterase